MSEVSLRLVTPQECVGVYIVRVFRLDGNPSLVSWNKRSFRELSWAMDGCSMLGGDIGSCQETHVNMPPLIFLGWLTLKVLYLTNSK